MKRRKEREAVPPRLCMSYPLRPDYVAQVVVPRDMTTEEAQRLCAFVQALVMPDELRAAITSAKP